MTVGKYERVLARWQYAFLQVILGEPNSGGGGLCVRYCFCFDNFSIIKESDLIKDNRFFLPVNGLRSA
ncbi:MAG TPA: hypothetical protein PLP41_09060 [Treponemataceae bacterium]|nr:hypothetical protein [Treponemataceae bacterium]HOS34556.1 hypothetical protein [Treponemataceae bacterium]